MHACHLPSGSDYHSYVSSLPATTHSYLNEMLDWDHGGVDKDLHCIAENMVDWEEKLSALLELTDVNIRDLKAMYANQPIILRYVSTALLPMVRSYKTGQKL